MAGFKTHITVSSALGIGYGATAFAVYNVPAPTCILAAGLCGVSGMLPDLDSGPGRPLRESLAFAAAVVPMMLADRVEHLGWAPETMILAGAAVYIAIRFGLGYFLRHYTVHRGMFHSLPAAAIFAEITFLLCSHEGEGLWLRYFNAGAVLTGFMSHLILDEIWSIEFRHGLPSFKSSFGTAIKFWSGSLWGNFSCYAKLAILSYLVSQDPIWANSNGGQPNQIVNRPVSKIRL